MIALDRWGRVLLTRRRVTGRSAEGGWEIPGGRMENLEAPDECALRVFEAETGCLLEQLSLFRVFRPAPEATDGPAILHVYFDDPDLDLAELEGREGREFRYFETQSVSNPGIAGEHRLILGQFLSSPAYRALFH